MKTLLLLALTSIKRVGDLHAFSVDDSCLKFGSADSKIILRPRLGYEPKVPTSPFGDQVVSLRALPPEEGNPALALLVKNCSRESNCRPCQAPPSPRQLDVVERPAPGPHSMNPRVPWRAGVHM